MKTLLITLLAFKFLSTSAQPIPARFLSDGIYWKLSGGDPKLARHNFDTITISKVNGDDLIFKRNDTLYYTHFLMLYPSFQLDSLQSALQKAEENEAYKISASRNRKLSELRRVEMIKKYGHDKGLLIYSGHIKIGMTKTMATDAWGKPKEIHRTILINSVSEQWVYGGLNFLYFTDGVLTAISN